MPKEFETENKLHAPARTVPPKLASQTGERGALARYRVGYASYFDVINADRLVDIARGLPLTILNMNRLLWD
jgi:hypothetical protein